MELVSKNPPPKQTASWTVTLEQVSPLRLRADIEFDVDEIVDTIRDEIDVYTYERRCDEMEGQIEDLYARLDGLEDTTPDMQATAADSDLVRRVEQLERTVHTLITHLRETPSTHIGG